MNSRKSILKKIRVNKVFDNLNNRYGSGTICVAKENYEKFYITRRQNLSPAYTSNFDDLPNVNQFTAGIDAIDSSKASVSNLSSARLPEK